MSLILPNIVIAKKNCAQNTALTPTHRKPLSPKQVLITLFVQFKPLVLEPPIWRRLLVSAQAFAPSAAGHDGLGKQSSL